MENVNDKKVTSPPAERCLEVQLGRAYASISDNLHDPEVAQRVCAVGSCVFSLTLEDGFLAARGICALMGQID